MGNGLQEIIRLEQRRAETDSDGDWDTQPHLIGRSCRAWP